MLILKKNNYTLSSLLPLFAQSTKERGTETTLDGSINHGKMTQCILKDPNGACLSERNAPIPGLSFYWQV